MKKIIIIFLASVLISSIAEAKTVHHHRPGRHHTHYISDQTPDEITVAALLKKHNKLKKKIVKSVEASQNPELKKNLSVVLDNIEKNIWILEN